MGLLLWTTPLIITTNRETLIQSIVVAEAPAATSARWSGEFLHPSPPRADTPRDPPADPRTRTCPGTRHADLSRFRRVRPVLRGPPLPGPHGPRVRRTDARPH